MTREIQLPSGHIVRATDEHYWLGPGARVAYSIELNGKKCVEEVVLPDWEDFEKRLARTLEVQSFGKQAG